jgi:hypothetical protein
VGDLVTIPVCADVGVVISIKEMIVNEFDLHQDVTLLAVVYWQNSARSRLELLKDLSKIN